MSTDCSPLTSPSLSDVPAFAPPSGEAFTRASVNRENAQHSTGPKTAEGKARVRWNALKSGIYCQDVVLPNEDQEAYLALGAALAAHWHPETLEESELVQTIQDSRWRLRRVVARETAMIALTTEQQRPAIEEQFEADPETLDALAQASAFQANHRLFDQLNRYEARLQRLVEKSLKQLAALTGDRPPNGRPASSAAPAPKPEPKPAMAQAAGASPSSSGFVPSLPQNPDDVPGMPEFTGERADEKKRRWLQNRGYHALAELV